MRLFNPNATMNEVLTTNGDFNLDEIRRNCKITEEFNGNFMLEATLAVSDSVFDKRVYENIVHEAIITEQDEHGIEVFRIYDIRKNKRTIDIMCRHITISEQITMFLKDVRPTETNGQGALTHMYNLAQCKRKEIIMTSDISNISTSYFINKNMYDALFKVDNCFVNRWGGETLRRGYNCYINSRVGQDRGVKIQSRKNLKGFEIKSNLDELTTRIIPRGFDGIEASQVDSKLINNYAQIYTKVAEYSDIKVKSENDEEGFDTLELAQEELTKRAKQQFDLFNVDKIQATYTIDFVELSRTEQYKDFILMEKVEIGDTITVKEDTYGAELKARVIKRVYSPSLRKRLETKVSNVQQEYKVISVESILKEMEELLNTSKNPSLSDYINTMINAGLKDSYVVLKPNELLIMDNKDINKAKNVTRYNKNGLGFSTTGYHGKYEYGFTIDGKINASIITAGVLSAIVIQNSDGSVRLDLSKTGGIDFFANKHKSISIERQKVEFFDWEDTTRTDAVGSIQSVRKGGAVEKPVMQLSHELGAGLSISHRRGDGSEWHDPYIDFDKFEIFDKKFSDYIDMFGYVPNNIYDATARKSISVWETIIFRDWIDFDARPRMLWGTWYGANSECVVNYSSYSGRMFISSPSGFEVNNEENTKSIFRAERQGVRAWDSNDNLHFSSETGKFVLGDTMWTTTGGGVYCNKPFSSANFLIDAPEVINVKRNERVFNHEIENTQLDLKHELYKKDLEIEDLKARVSALEQLIAKMV